MLCEDVRLQSTDYKKKRPRSRSYYSFYEQFTDASDWQTGLAVLYRDQLSEHPDTVNALVRVASAQT